MGLSTTGNLPGSPRGGDVSVRGRNRPPAFNSAGVEPDASDPIFRSIGAYLAPDDAPPTKK